MANSRVQWVDVVKYVCIMFVIIHHLEANTDILEAVYLPFVLDGFLFAAGYVYHHREAFKSFLVKKIRGLFIPWLFFSVLNILLSQVLSFNEHYNLIDEIKWNLLQIRGKGDGMWFVAALFISFIPFYFIISKYERTSKRSNEDAVIVGVLLSLTALIDLYKIYFNSSILPWGSPALPWHLEYIPEALMWMFLGYLFRTKFESIFDKKMNNIITIAILSVYLLGRIFISFVLKSHFNKAITITYLYVSAFLGVFVLIYVSKMIRPNRYILYLGQNTLLCFAFHGKIYSLLQTVTKKFALDIYTKILENEVLSSLFAIAFSVIVSFLIIAPIYFVNRYFPFLIGKRYKTG